MVRQNNRYTGATAQCRAYLHNVAFHVGAIDAQERDIETGIGAQPEILVLQIEKVLYVAQRVVIELRDTLDAGVGIEIIGVFGNGTRQLYNSIAL